MKRLVSARYCVGIVAFSVALMFLLALAVQILISSILQTLAPSLLQNASISWLLGTLPLYCIGMPLSLIPLRLLPTQGRPQKKSISPLVWLCIFSACLVCTYLLSFVGDAINTIFSSLLGIPPVNQLASMTVQSPLWFNLLFLVILAPIMEEIFLRKLLIDRLLPHGELAAVLLSGMAFGLVHGNFHQLFYACASGILFGWVYVKTHNLALNVSLHAALNLLGGVWMAEIEKLKNESTRNGMLQNPETVADIFSLIYFVILIVCMVICAMLLIRYRKWIAAARLEKSEEGFSRREWLIILCKNPLVWFFLAFCGLMFLM